MTDIRSLWTSEEATELTGGSSSTNWNATGVSIDSRTIGPGDLFIPISGPYFDGHNFIESALTKGAVASITSGSTEDFPEGAHLLKVTDTIKALNELGRGGRNRSMARVIAVTGSVGKTGVKEALGRLLSEQGKTSFSLGSFNNHFGVPLSLARLPKNADYGIFELGMNHSGELKQLSQIVRPHVAVITTVDIAHTEFFSSTHDIARAKAEVFTGLQEGGTAILNRDNQYFNLLNSAALSAGAEKVIAFGVHNDAQFKLVEFTLNSEGSSVKVCFDNNIFTYQLSIPGQHWVQNSLAVLAAVYAVGADMTAAARSFVNIKPFKGRGQLHTIPIQGGHFELIDDSYNACPVSVAAAIEVLSRLKPKSLGRRICVLGDMKELGENSTKLHCALANKISDALVDFVFTVGSEMKCMCDQLPNTIKMGHADRSEDLIQPLLDVIKPGDIILVKGSASYQMSKVVDRLLNFKNDLIVSPNDIKEGLYVI
jgi:UDP-N-acetylmuramoyl-tripeptide--D-alanyl-D-alanine ligase